MLLRYKGQEAVERRYSLATVRLISATATTPAQITRPTPVQAQLLKFLGVDPARPP